MVSVSPERLARPDAPQGLLIEEFETLHTPLIFLQQPFGESPQGTRLPHRQGMIAEYARAQMAERPRRGRLAKARPGACMPWAYPCYGYRSAETARRRAPGEERARGGRSGARYVSCLGGRTAALSPDHPTPERRQNAHAHGQKHGLAPRDGPPHARQAPLSRAGTSNYGSPCSPRRVSRRSTTCGR